MDGLTLAGTIRGKDAEFTYHPGKDGGALIIQGYSWEETISNKSVIAVLDNRKKGGDSEDQSQNILLVPSASQPAPDFAETAFRFENVIATNLPQSFIDANLVSPRISQLSSSRISPPASSRSGTAASYFYVIISTGSGTGQAQQYFDNILKPVLAASGIQAYAYYVHTTYSDKSVTNFASAVLLPRANEGHLQTVLLLSGDGSVIDIVDTLLSSPRNQQYVKPAIGLVTMGTGNAFANSTGLNRDFTRGLRHFYRGKTKMIPTFTATFSPGSEFLVDEGNRTELLASSETGLGVVYGAVVCSWALHASLVANSDTTEYRKYGLQRFQMAAKELLAPSDGSEPHIYKGKITLYKNNEGEETEQILDSREYFYLLATLVSNLEENFTVSPHSKPLDGQLRLLRFGPLSSAEVMKIMGLAYQGGAHVEDDAVGYEGIERLRIDFEEEDSIWRRVCVDGKIIRVGQRGWVEVQRNLSADVLDIIADLE
ncbi:hypothetical protein MMC28_011146 [Mycoblastus sanguinarius]|nr:hypothetical protein [Mycoblastus sanguinarius]